uniref:Uncharacterized protein n=1 Tax=Minutocellus polymorphus TaxID=265543 RepID=A0A7S0AU35_9STRA|mmetsp:Transcript_3467/g.5982  ORF Transcript_3467/g.5982 Transcript_3467/m.5982 type:complete len:265 (+) Transcript_3467:514-1308(+)
MCKESDFKNNAKTNSSAKALRALYILTTFLSLFMVGWIVVFPSSWLMGRSEFHDHIISETLVKKYDGTSVSPRTVTKYAGHSLVQFTHIAPGAIWAAAIPLQLHPKLRRQYRLAHKMIGYAFIVSALLMAFGICVIFARDLTFHNDYDGIPPPDDMELLQMKVSTTFLTTWFVLTALLAVYNAGWTKDIQSHQQWIIRHIGSGLWIAVQRIVVVFCQGAGLVDGPMVMRNLFGNAATGSVFFTILLAEYSIRCLKNVNGVKKRV